MAAYSATMGFASLAFCNRLRSLVPRSSFKTLGDTHWKKNYLKVEWTGFIHLLVWRLLYWELEDDELSPVKTRKITRTTGTMIFWFRQLPQGRVHTRVCHSWSEESPEGTCPTICDLGRCPLQKVLQEVLALPSNIGRRSAHCLNKLIQTFKNLSAAAFLMSSQALIAACSDSSTLAFEKS